MTYNAIERPRQRGVQVDNPRLGSLQRLQELRRENVHEAETHDQLRRVGEDQPRELSIVFLARKLDTFRCCGVLLLVLHKVVVFGWDVGLACALEAECGLAVGNYADDCCVYLTCGYFIDHGLQV